MFYSIGYCILVTTAVAAPQFGFGSKTTASSASTSFTPILGTTSAATSSGKTSVTSITDCYFNKLLASRPIKVKNLIYYIVHHSITYGFVNIYYQYFTDFLPFFS